MRTPKTTVTSSPQHSSSSPVIQLTDVSKQFGSLQVLDHINLTVEPGEKIAVIGASGCGKSTLLRCINALEAVDEGTINVNGMSLNDPGLDINAYRARIGTVFQDYNLFPHLTVLENLILGPVKVKKVPKAQAIEQAKLLLEQIGILDKINAYPENLSGGQQQRVAIARSLAMEPSVILFDEPTSALDPQMTRSVQAMIEQVAQVGMTLLMVTHDIAFARRVADRILFMHNGQIEEEGSPDQLLDQPKKETTRAFLADL